ncbi:MAG: hypothetical protein KC912_14630 [Proteobacteria bacterium]|nr:hypothetical protein [Pseudomonadota bacterium]
MKNGAKFKDGEGQVWTVGEAMPGGGFARSWIARTEEGLEAVLRVPLRLTDIPAETPVPEGVDIASKKALLELGELLKAGELPFLPRLIGVVDLEPGKRKNPKSPGLLLHRYPTSLARKLEGGASLAESLRLLDQVLTQLVALHKSGRVHGNLRPENILINEAGEPVLADLITPTADKWRAHFGALTPGRVNYQTPESTEASPADDAFALCALAWLAAVSKPQGDPRHGDSRAIPVGMDKVDLAAVRDAALASLKRGTANARFTTRVAERLGAMLSRGLSGPVEPSPPYRFLTLRDLTPRFREVAHLVDPTVAEVGKVLLSAAADKNGVFGGGAPVAFSVSAGSSSGNVGHEDIAIGLQVTDLDADGDARVRVPDTKFDVASHPSGRLRFSFELPEMAPGRYNVRVAFSIRDSGHEPTVAQGTFEVRPPPGYVPPAPEPAREDEPLRLPSRPRPAPAPTLPEPVAASEAPSAPNAEIFALPIAPSSPGISPTDPGVPPSDPGIPSAELGQPAPTVDDRTVPAIGPAPEDPPSAVEIRSAPKVARPAPVVSLQAPTPAPTPAPIEPPAPTPAIQAPRPAPIPLPKSVGTPIGEAPTQPRPAPVPAPVVQPPPAPAGPGTWEADLPNPEPVQLPPTDYLPGQSVGTDLPTWDEDKPSALPPIAQRAVDMVSRDPITAVGALAFVFAIVAAIAMVCTG